MYAFLLLVPLILVSAVIGYLVSTSPQLLDYVDNATRSVLIEKQSDLKSLAGTIGFNFGAYVIMSFALVAVVRTISTPLPKTKQLYLRAFQRFLEQTFVAIPSLTLLLLVWSLLEGDHNNLLLLAAAGVLVVGLLATLILTAVRPPLVLVTSTRSSISWTDAAALGVVLLVVVMVVAFVIEPSESVIKVGLFPVLMLSMALALIAFAAFFSLPLKWQAAAVAVVLVSQIFHLFVLPPRQFAHTEYRLPAGTHEVRAVKDLRQLPSFDTAFLQWLQHRRPAIDAYHQKQATYPIFFAAAQGGGIYAAVHPAIVLSRLVDFCPEFAHHLFGITSVSGGGLGAGLFAELLRSHPDKSKGPAHPAVGCSQWTTNQLENATFEFFTHDFLSPIVASALLFEVPGTVFRPLTFGQDRASALELGFEAGWRRTKLELKTAAAGLDKSFYGRWDPRGREPALFMVTTSIAVGIPVLVSQIDWAINAPAPENITKADLLRLFNARDRQSVANILDFRPDLQLKMSTAIGLSARFPFVTPPGTIDLNKSVKRSEGPFREASVLQLTDGGFYDNGGVAVSRELLADMQNLLAKDARFEGFRDKVSLHLLQFTNLLGARKAGPDVGNTIEWTTPLLAFENVRQARSGITVELPEGVRRHSVALLDEWYEDFPLTWLFSEEGKIALNKRSSWLAGPDNHVCCEVSEPNSKRTTAMELDEDGVKRVEALGYKARQFTPNQAVLSKILELVQEGEKPGARR